MATLGQLRSILAAAVGDTLTSGSPTYTQGSGFKWAEPAYNMAFDFAVDVLKRMFMIRQESTVTFLDDMSIFDLTAPANMVYLSRLARETSVGSGQYERVIPLDWITVKRDAATPVIHMDGRSMSRSGTYLGSARVMFQGYQYPVQPAGVDAAEPSISEPALMMAAKYFLHLNTPTRDPQELLKGMRLAEQARVAYKELTDDLGYLEPDGGIWLGDV